MRSVSSEAMTLARRNAATALSHSAANAPCARRNMFISPPWLMVRPKRFANAPCSRS